MDQAFDIKTADANITYDPHTLNVGESLVVSTELFTFTLSAIRAFQDDISGYNR